jgi:PAS domain S-box-containing protein
MQSKQTIDRLKDDDFLRTVLTNLPAVAFVIAPDGTVLFVEGRGIALAGFKRDDVLGINASKYFSLYPGFEEKLRRVLEGETIASTVIAPNQRSLEVTYSPMRDDQCSICGVIGVAQDVTERIEREQALRERESWFRAIFESAQDSIFIKDESLRYVQVSPAMEQLFGLPASELVGKTDEDLFGPEAGAHLREVDARVLDGEVVEEENTKPVNGEPRSFHVIKAPMRDAAGAITGLCGIARDITERNRAEERMLKSESLHRALIETTDTGYVVVDDQGVVLDANPEYVRLTGRFALEEICGKSVVDWTADHDKEKNAEAIEECSQKGFIRNLEIDYLDSKGNIIPVEINATVIERCGTPIILSLCRDITERKRAAEALRESQEVLQAVLNSIPVRVFWKDKNSRYLGCNMPFARDAGFEKPEDIIGKDDHAMGWREQAELYRADDRGVVESGNAKLHIEEPQTTPSGEQIHLLTSKVPLRDVSGEIVGVLGTYQDITDRKYADEVLQESERRLSSIYETVGDVIFHLRIEVDGSYRFLSVNQAFCNVTGLSKEMIVGKLVNEVIPEPSLSIALGKYQQAIKENSIVRWEETSDYPVGQVTGEVSIAPVYDNEGSCTHLVGSVHNVTERKRAAQALRESENAYRAIFENTGSATVIIEEDTIISLVNSEFARLTGLAREEVEGKMSWTQFVVPEDLEMMVARHRLRRENPDAAPAAYEFRLHDKNGAIKHILLNVVMIAGTSKSVASLTDITERKRIEEALRTSESAYRAIFENTGTATMIVEEDTTITLVNSEFEKLTGYTKAEVEGKMRWTEFTVKEEVDRMLDQHRLRRIDPSAALKSYEFQLLGKNGVATDVLMTVDVIPGTGQSVASCLDITERKEAERELRESEQKFSRAFQSGAALMAITEVGTDIFVDVNDAFLTILGFSRDEIIGKTIQESGALVEVARFEAAKQEAADSRQLPDQEMMIRTKSGDVRYGIFSADRIHVGGKNCLLTVMTDITKRRLAEQALRESENAYRAIFENTGNATLILEEDTTISLVNSEFEKLTGYTKAETEGKMHWTELVVEEDIDRMLDQHRLRRTDSNTALKSYEFRMRIKNGMVKDIFLSIDIIPGTAKSIASFVDITARKRAEKEREQLQRQLQQSQKLEAIGTMAGGIAHDFNNILTGILGFTELVCSEAPEGSEAYDNLTEVLKAGRRARDLIKQILSFSRRAETEKSLISLVTIVKDALKLIRSVTSSHISIKQNLTASPTRAILADPTQMHQVVLNLCINAADAMPDGGVLEISLEEVQVETESRPEQTQLSPGCYLKFTVRDNGTGMPAEIQERIFEPYFTTKQVGKGTGMGLAVVHGVIKDHGGSIAVSSEPGKGTLFEIYLPVVEAKLDTEIVSPPVVAVGSESILFVDDESMITNLQRSQLGKWGYRVTATENSMTALGIFRSSPRDFDLVITDQSMPGLTGVKLAQAIHEINPNTPIILCTGFDEGVSRENAGTIGIRAILVKPVTGAEFSRTIRMVLDEASKPSPATS